MQVIAVINQLSRVLLGLVEPSRSCSKGAGLGLIKSNAHLQDLGIELGIELGKWVNE